MGSENVKLGARRSDLKQTTYFHLPTSICYLPLITPMTFEDLDSWQHAREMVSKIYDLTRLEPLCRDFGICTQLQRAGVSIMSNIAEGFERAHIPEKGQFYNIARGSAAEVRSLLYVIEDNFPKSALASALLREQVVSVGKLLSGLIRSTESRRSRP
jgi:four helix bundle protein